ncbi:hypothetical protein Mesau_05711 [Mesorhizobium australicum WSM2073]|uniref:Uncharacterized protein n=4 Tax=Phyllobacteriaceae TaxID=69277 RepID=L0KSA4_MESAW|nr:hypothetical protein Mesci_5659 [Mesorhizobium ciceri biovar biserrulae WSM1271]AEH90629.1 hypothetical protein Mesop_6241 [Mesorhizobium opportunistum WSM2075]AGB48001.1 hypothetical protein Mesau_05711 [Mesorhizobium australicum WSM2073]
MGKQLSDHILALNPPIATNASSCLTRWQLCTITRAATKTRAIELIDLTLKSQGGP